MTHSPSSAQSVERKDDDSESDCQFTAGHSAFEKRQKFVAPVVGSWPWLRGCINAITKREEFLGGQRTRYVQLDEVLAWIDEGERRAAASAQATGQTVERGIHELSVVIDSLRETGWYRDEEGESINALDDLLSALRSAS